MDLTLTPLQAEIRARARAVAKEHLAPRAAEHDKAARFPAKQVKALAEADLLAMLVPKAFGGGEYGSVCYSLAMTEVARGCASSAVTMAVTNMVGDAIVAWGDDAQKRLHCPKLASAEYMAGSFCLSEPEAGSDAASLKAVARRDGDDYVLSGQKVWITSGDQAGVLLIMAKTDLEAGSKGISAFLVEPSMAGFSVGRHEEKMGLRASSTVTINLDEVRVPASARIGDEGVGFKIAMRALDGGRIGVGSQALGIGLCAQDAATRFLRGQTNPSSEAKALLAQSEAELEAARMLV
ncbi:MAG: acyl-CoA dehydrogenase family protein, partial [Myxococcales bacterium]|nr:acyl-CoA dehydrogenase family protein [Myxococcales bacterium]